MNVEIENYLTPLNLPYISFAEDTFVEGETYTFELTASYALFGHSSATVDFEINHSPSSGSFVSDI